MVRNHTRDFKIERAHSASSICNHKYDFRPKLHDLKFNCHFITSILKSHMGGAVAIWLVLSSPERVVRVRALSGGIVLCSWARHLTLTVPLSTQVYKWVPVNCWGNLTNCGGRTCDGLASCPGGVEILLA